MIRRRRRREAEEEKQKKKKKRSRRREAEEEEEEKQKKKKSGNFYSAVPHGQGRAHYGLFWLGLVTSGELAEEVVHAHVCVL